MSKIRYNDSSAVTQYPPCQGGCPVHTDVQEYVRQISVGDYDKAVEAIIEPNPLASVCGMICAHPCETECRRKDVDEAVSIRALKRFALENGKWPEVKKAEVTRSEKVAVVGGGPAGLAAARALAEMGFAVTIFERSAEAGGAITNFIPHYRLPMDAMRKDVSRVAEAGVEIKTGVEMGKDFSIEDLAADYQAVVLALGLPTSKAIPIPGSDAKDVLLALPFLNSAKYHDFKFEPGRKVLVVGGGNVAMDVARQAVRCGAENVKLACLECRTTMPAFEWEIEEAIEEGVEMFPAWGPKQIVTDDAGNITGMEVQEVLSVFDEQKRFNPQFGDTKNVIDVNTVIFAIGQGNDNLSYLTDSGIELNERGMMKYDMRTMQTTRPGVFAAGEVVFGPGSAVKAMSTGQKAALAVQSFLNNEPFDASLADRYEVLDMLDEETVKEVKPIDRLAVPFLDEHTRAQHNEHVEIGYDERAALCESRRCMDCAAGAECIDEICAVCLTCLRTCPYGVPHIDDEGNFTIRNEECQACGLCVGICPASAIRFRNHYAQHALNHLSDAVEQAKGNGGPATVVFTCSYGAFAERDFMKYVNNGKPQNLAVVRVPCVAKVEVQNILEAFDLGAEGVFVAGCEQEDECTYRDVAKWAEKRAGRASEILEQIGLEDRIEYLNLTREEVKDFAPVAEKFLAKVDAVLNGGGGEE
ncbi:FAD-dependent oxidoreductase [Dethiobacter alkaliphilus]|uniref:FAD-dependent oxidoreductase n=1 Tax=Dethiobacter alkaliphilus TaxID=427926 RepID=UPI0023EE7E92|nr:FAD-dependent oxidoreductase [Dethiobacter alkaliphilus]